MKHTLCLLIFAGYSLAWLLLKDGSLLMQKVPLGRMQKTKRPGPVDFNLSTYEHTYWFGKDSLTDKWHYAVDP